MSKFVNLIQLLIHSGAAQSELHARNLVNFEGVNINDAVLPLQNLSIIGSFEVKVKVGDTLKIRSSGKIFIINKVAMDSILEKNINDNFT